MDTPKPKPKPERAVEHSLSEPEPAQKRTFQKSTERKQGPPKAKVYYSFKFHMLKCYVMPNDKYKASINQVMIRW